MEVVIDTSFILTCLNQKIDFFRIGDDVFDGEVEWVVPKEVVREIEILSEAKGKDKKTAKLALELLAISEFKTVSLGNENVDKGLIEYGNLNDSVIATLDKEIKRRYKGNILLIRGKKKLDIIKGGE